MSATTIPVARAAPVYDKKHYPPPTTKISKHPLRWFRNKAQELITSIPMSHIVLLAWVALYYVCFELVHPVKIYWDTVFSRHVRLLSQPNWDTWRHLFRNGGEAYLVTMTVLFATFNPYAHKIKRLHTAGQVIGRVFFSLLVAVPIFIVGGILIHHLQEWLHTGLLSPTIGAHPNLAQKLYADQWTTKIVVILAGVFGARRPMFPVFVFVMEYFAERRVAHGKKDHWWHLAPYRAMVRQYQAAGVKSAQANRAKLNNSVRYLMSGGAVLVIALAIYGGYILNHFAK